MHGIISFAPILKGPLYIFVNHNSNYDNRYLKVYKIPMAHLIK